MKEVPTLAEAVQDTERLVGLPFGTLWALLREVGRVEREITTAMLAAANRPVSVAEQDHLLTFEEAAARLKIAPATAQKWFRKAPYNAAVVVRSHGIVRVSAQRLDDILLNGGVQRGRRKAVSA